MYLGYFIYLYLFVFLLASLGVILSKNTMHSVLFLVLVFLLSAVVFLLLGAEFLAIMLIIVYVGAISILFLFVVMLLNLRVVELHNTFLNYLPIGAFIGLYFFLELTFLLHFDFNEQTGPLFFNNSGLTFWLDSIFSFSNLELFGFMLYNYCNFFVIIISIILLISMLAVIILTRGFDVKSDKASYLYSLGRLEKSVNLSFWRFK